MKAMQRYAKKPKTKKVSSQTFQVAIITDNGADIDASLLVSSDGLSLDFRGGLASSSSSARHGASRR